MITPYQEYLTNMGKLTLEQLHAKRRQAFSGRPLIDHLFSKYTNIKADPLNSKITSLVNILCSMRVHTIEDLLSLDVREVYKRNGMGKVKINLLYSLIGEEEPFYTEEVTVVKKEKRLILKDKYK